MKQTAVEWLIEQWPILESQLPSWLVEQAKAMEKQQIIDAYYQIGKDHQDMIFPIEKDAEQYYKETYTKDVRYYIIDCGEEIRNTVLFDITDQLKKQGHYFIVNATCDPNQFDIKRVTKEQFYESNTRI